MSGPTRPPDQGAPRQPWSPDQGPQGVTCPACGLANEPGARVCRNCGLPIASSDDPIRGVSAGHVDMPSAQRSGLSATVGLVLVVGLLLVAGTLAVSGGGILSGGGRLGVSDATPSPAAENGVSTTPAPGGAATLDPGGEQVVVSADIGHEFDFTCGSGEIRDANRAKWRLDQFLGGANDEFDRVRFRLTRRKGSSKPATAVQMEWMTPREAREQFGVSGVQGQRAIVVTFDGQVNLEKNQRIDSLFLEGEGVQSLRTVDSFVGDDGKVRAVIGLRGDGCARLDAPRWKKKNKKKRAEVVLQILPQAAAQEQ